MKKSISIILALTLIFSSMGIGVFATDLNDQTPPAESTDLVSEGVEGEDPAEDPNAVGDVVDNDSEEGDQDVVTEGEPVTEDAVDNEEEGDEPEEVAAPKMKAAYEPLPTLSVQATSGNNSAVISGFTKDEMVKVVVLLNGTEERTESPMVSGGKVTVANLKESGTYTFKVTLGDPAATVDVSGQVVILAAPKLKTYSSFKSVWLEWKKDPAATKYLIYAGKKKVGEATNSDKAYDDANKVAFKVEDLSDAHNAKKTKFKVVAVNAAGVSPAAEKSDSAVKQMYIKLTFKQNVRLQSHDGKKKKHSFKSGNTIYATGFIKGFYYFYYKINGKDYLFRGSYMRFGNKKALFTKKFNYNEKEAEYFVNDSKQKSKTKYMIWVNLYTQHLYMFKGKKGKWRVKKIKYDGKKFKDWEISSGTATNPSPWGMKLKFGGSLTNIYKRQVVFPGHGKRWWNFYHSQSALHGPVSGGYGVPHSHGCIRNPIKKALFLFYGLPKKTRVLVY